MPPSVERIVSVMKARGVVPPCRVWSAGFKDILDGVPQGGIPEGHHGKWHATLEDAAEEYLYVNANLLSGKQSKYILITIVGRIMDSSDPPKQVYP